MVFHAGYTVEESFPPTASLARPSSAVYVWESALTGVVDF